MLERVKRLGAGEQPAVDEERRRSRHTRVSASLSVGVDDRAVLVLVHARVEFRRIQPERGRRLLQVCIG